MRPNILLVVSDQHRADCLGASAEYPVRTPNLDELASDGMRFSSAYTPIPLCTPARQSLLTGLRPEATGGLWNYDLGPKVQALTPDAYSWPRELQRAGYRTSYIGKWHVSPDHGPTSFGYDSWITLEDYRDWRARRYPGEPSSVDWFGGIDHVPTRDSRTHWMADRAAEFIKEASECGRPWHLRLDFLEPHLPCQPTDEYSALYPADDVPEWRDFPDEFVNKPYIQRQQLLNWQVEEFTWQDWAPVVARYYAMISQLDDAIGQVLRSLDEVGATSDTLVIYTSDHGDMCGSHRMMDKHYVMYDSVVRVPLILRWPGRIAAGTVARGFAYNTLDLGPTLSLVTGVNPPDPAHGASLFDWRGDALVASRDVRERTHVVSTYNGQQFGLFIQRMIRTRQWKYVWNPTDVDELYDLVNDSAELVNRIDDPRCDSVLTTLRQDLYRHLVDVGDGMVANPWMARQLQSGRKLSSTGGGVDTVPGR